jgi:hypothetical protein
MVRDGKMMWNEIVNANCKRARRTGSVASSHLANELVTREFITKAAGGTARL